MFKWKKRYKEQFTINIDMWNDFKKLQSKYRDLEITLEKSNDLLDKVLKLAEK